MVELLTLYFYTLTAFYSKLIPTYKLNTMLLQ